MRGQEKRREPMPEQQEERKIFYDADLNIEAYSLCGIVQRLSLIHIL